MAVDKDKVLVKLDVKYKGKALSKTSKDKLAAAWAAKIETDDDIDDYIDDRDDVIQTLISEADKRVTDAVTKTEAKHKKPADKADKGENDDNDDEDETAGLDAGQKLIFKKLKELSGEVNQIKTEKTKSNIAERFANHADLKDIPAIFKKGRTPQTDEEFDATVEEVKNDYAEYSKTHKVEHLGGDQPTNTGGKGGKGGGTETKPASKEELDAIAGKIGM